MNKMKIDMSTIKLDIGYTHVKEAYYKELNCIIEEAVMYGHEGLTKDNWEGAVAFQVSDGVGGKEPVTFGHLAHTGGLWQIQKANLSEDQLKMLYELIPNIIRAKRLKEVLIDIFTSHRTQQCTQQ